MKKKVEIIIVVVIIILGSLIYSFIDKNNMVYDKSFEDNEYITIGSLQEGSLQQSFVCKEDVLDGIRVKTIKNGELGDVSLTYKITDISNGKEYDGNVEGSEIKNNKYYYFKIGEQLKGCKGKSFEIEIAETGTTDVNGVGFYMTPKAADGTTLTINEERKDGTIIMKAVSHRFDVETFVMLLVSIAFVVAFMRVLYRLFNK